MYREIRFRAWDYRHKKMFEVEYLDWDHGTKHQVDYVDDEKTEFTVDKPRHGHIWGDDGDECALMQYTGLKDENGVEIYEGDITQDKDEIRWMDGNGLVGEGTPEHTGFYLVKDSWGLPLSRLSNVIIVGNIYAAKNMEDECQKT